MLNSDFFGNSVLFLCAHPDDAEICAGGTIRKLVNSGREVNVVIFSLSEPREKRLLELKAGLEILNVNFEIIEGSHKQVADMEMKKIVYNTDYVIDKYRPTCVVTHFYLDTHLDHRLLSDAVISTSRNREFNLLFMNSASIYAYQKNEFNYNLLVDISEEIEYKYNAIKCHTSQKNVMESIEAFRCRDLFYGSICKAKYAEAYILAKYCYK
jgi:LmbE family N-acetylglucosaminyl deacetylase